MIVPTMDLPATATTPSSPWSDRAASSTAARMASRSVTSHGTGMARSPSSARSSSSRSLRRASMATEPPAATIDRQAAAPMPLDAPVTRTRRRPRSTLRFISPPLLPPKRPEPNIWSPPRWRPAHGATSIDEPRPTRYGGLNEYLVTRQPLGEHVESSVEGAARVTVDQHNGDNDGEEFGLFDDAVAGDTRDPYPELAQARRDHPVQRLDSSLMPHEESTPVFFVYRYDDVFRVLRDSETFSSGHIIDLIMGPVMGEHIMLGMDGAQHTRYRSLVSTAFRPKVMARWESELAERIANDLIDKFADQGRAELVREFTFPYPTQIIAGMLGLPREDYKQFQRWSIGILSFLTKQEEAIAASQEVKEYVAEILEDRRREARGA